MAWALRVNALLRNAPPRGANSNRSQQRRGINLQWRRQALGSDPKKTDFPPPGPNFIRCAVASSERCRGGWVLGRAGSKWPLTRWALALLAGLPVAFFFLFQWPTGPSPIDSQWPKEISRRNFRKFQSFRGVFPRARAADLEGGTWGWGMLLVRPCSFLCRFAHAQMLTHS